MNHFYSPFTDEKGAQKSIFQIQYDDLAQLSEKEVSEGYKIEYKEKYNSEVKRKHLSKVITSFANEHGGWLFIGIRGQDNTGLIEAIIPIPNEDFDGSISGILLRTTSPIPKYYSKFLPSPEDTTVGVLAIWVPEGFDTPYISKGNIYKRVSSHSTPTYEIRDRLEVDRLYDKSRKNREDLLNFCHRELPLNCKGVLEFYFIPTLNGCSRCTEDTDEIFSIFNEEIEKPYEIIDDEGNILFSHSFPFPHQSITMDSLVFRNSEFIDDYASTFVWEFFHDGKARFHLPFPYYDPQLIIPELERRPSFVRNTQSYNEFEYLQGKHLFQQSTFCESLYVRLLKRLLPEVQDFYTVFKLSNVNRCAIVIESEKFYDYTYENGLKFCQKNEYLFDNDFEPIKVSDCQSDTGRIVMSYFPSIANAFGFRYNDLLDIIFDYFYQESRKTAS